MTSEQLMVKKVEIIEQLIWVMNREALVARDECTALANRYGPAHHKTRELVIAMSLLRGRWEGMVKAWEILQGSAWPDDKDPDRWLRSRKVG